MWHSKLEPKEVALNKKLITPSGGGSINPLRGKGFWRQVDP
jgi:hypothetical protein